MSESSSVFWAAFGGSVAAGLITLIVVLTAEWFRWFLDRPLIKLYLRIGNLLKRETNNSLRPVEYMYSRRLSSTPDYVFVNFSNPHTKPVVIVSFGLKYRRGEFSKLKLVMIAVKGFDFPYRVEGGANLMQWYTTKQIFDLLSESGKLPRDLKYIWAEAASGKMFHCKIEKKILKELEQLFSEYKSEDCSERG